MCSFYQYVYILGSAMNFCADIEFYLVQAVKSLI